LRLSRELGEWDAQWARAEQTRRELEAGPAPRGEGEGPRAGCGGEAAARCPGARPGAPGPARFGIEPARARRRAAEAVPGAQGGGARRRGRGTPEALRADRARRADDPDRARART